jgi:hypothetical protein
LEIYELQRGKDKCLREIENAWGKWKMKRRRDKKEKGEGKRGSRICM